MHVARVHACLAVLHPILALASRARWTGATYWLQYYVAALETNLAHLNAVRRHDTE